VLIKFWSLTGSPCASLHDLDESMSVLCFEKDNLLSLVCKTYILNTKHSDKLYFRKSLRLSIWEIILDCRWNKNNRPIFDHNQWMEHH
jgi:hypothetical protein